MTIVSLDRLYFRYSAPLQLRLGRRSAHPWVLADTNLEVFQGEIVAITGSNGAGKSTLLRLLALLLYPTRGDLYLWGVNSRFLSSLLRRQIAWLGSGERTFFWRLTGRQNLYFFAALRGINAETVDQRLAELADTLELNPLLNQRVDRYSRGQKQRLAWARLLLSQPALLLLDEPFLGLDDLGQRQVWQLLTDWWPPHSPPTLLIATPKVDSTIPWSQVVNLDALPVVAPL